MTDYISREAAIKIASGFCHPANIATELAKLPAADVRPVVRGKWVKEPIFYRCSECGDRYPAIKGYMSNHFCPNCGAKMEE